VGVVVGVPDPTTIVEAVVVIEEDVEVIEEDAAVIVEDAAAVVVDATRTLVPKGTTTTFPKTPDPFNLSSPNPKFTN
jgi:phosphohistidine swiveling domain-containing protein